MNENDIRPVIDIDNEPINKKFKFLKDEKNDSVVSENEELMRSSKKKENDEDEDAMSDEHEIPPKGFDYPLEQDASDMLDEVELVDGRFPNVTDRYFTPYYQLDVQQPGDDICIRIHSNRICMISLAPSHIIFKENKKIQSCNYKVSDKLDRTKNKTSGKSKHGAQPLQANSNLCCLTCTDGTSYMIKCCMIGKLIEVNEMLTKNPEFLQMEPHFGGYIAIILPNLKHLDKMKQNLLTQELYEEAIKKRIEINSQNQHGVRIETVENKSMEIKEQKNKEVTISEINKKSFNINTNVEQNNDDKDITAMEIV